jgi:hypothetical protein
MQGRSGLITPLSGVHYCSKEPSPDTWELPCASRSSAGRHQQGRRWEPLVRRPGLSDREGSRSGRTAWSSSGTASSSAVIAAASARLARRAGRQRMPSETSGASFTHLHGRPGFGRGSFQRITDEGGLPTGLSLCATALAREVRDPAASSPQPLSPVGQEGCPGPERPRTAPGARCRGGRSAWAALPVSKRSTLSLPLN